MCKLFIVAILSRSYEEARALYMHSVCCGMTWNLGSCGPDFSYFLRRTTKRPAHWRHQQTISKSEPSDQR
jgi:hypothetical protein